MIVEGREIGSVFGVGREKVEACVVELTDYDEGEPVGWNSEGMSIRRRCGLLEVPERHLPDIGYGMCHRGRQRRSQGVSRFCGFAWS